MDPKTAQSIWTEHHLLLPTEFVKELARNQQVILTTIVLHGSIAAFAAWFGVSASFVKSVIAFPVAPSIGVQDVVEAIKKYKSIRIATRMINALRGSCNWSEAATRRIAEEQKLDLREILDWSTNNHSNGKGRRAEMWYIEHRVAVGFPAEDMNQTLGSQADWDVTDSYFGKVNVKSSKRYEFKAKTRSADKYFWKFSTSGKEKCDYLALIAYDEMGKEVIGILMMKSSDVGEGTTCTLTGSQLQKPTSLGIGLATDQDLSKDL